MHIVTEIFLALASTVVILRLGPALVIDTRTVILKKQLAFALKRLNVAWNKAAHFMMVHHDNVFIPSKKTDEQPFEGLVIGCNNAIERLVNDVFAGRWAYRVETLQLRLTSGYAGYAGLRASDYLENIENARAFLMRSDVKQLLDKSGVDIQKIIREAERWTPPKQP
tara:strand:+ start:607 stop:1107 length:501 start_codon:yes stop_codon:yes gene_type:complete